MLQESGGGTVAELAKGLEMAPVSVRHHLDILQGDALIRVDRVRRGNVGRPRQVYVLTNEAHEHFPDNFAALADSLMRQMKAVMPPEDLSRALHVVAREMASDLDSDRSFHADEQMTMSLLETRLDTVADFLCERGYLARWERDVDGNYLLHKHNCPYAGVSSEHDELCEMDQQLMNTLLDGCECARTQSIAGNATCCTYRIELPQRAPIALQIEGAPQ